MSEQTNLIPDNLEAALENFKKVVDFNEAVHQEPWEEVDEDDEQPNVSYYTETSQDYADSVGAIPATQEELEAHGLFEDENLIEHSLNDDKE